VGQRPRRFKTPGSDYVQKNPTQAKRRLERATSQFSVERLLRLLVALDQDVRIMVKPHR
jgi:hypothetical protein